MTIPQINASFLFDVEHSQHLSCLDQVRVAAEETGFMTLTDTDVQARDVVQLIDVYRRFFLLPESEKAAFDMTKTGSNRGWGAPGAEQVDPDANPDFKEVFDCGLTLPDDHPLSAQTYYAPNRWPENPPDFRLLVQAYYDKVMHISLALLTYVALAIGRPADFFADKFSQPMALLRGNYYPPRPSGASDKDFGIAPHTDYGCLTLLATDGSPGLEVQTRDKKWIHVTASPGTFVINFGEMLQMWTEGQVVATPHRVIGGSSERLSVPFFFNPRFDTNVAPQGDGRQMLAGDYLAMRYDQTYVHRQQEISNP